MQPSVRNLHFEGDFWTVSAGIILVFCNIQSCTPMIKYWDILQVKDWVVILILGLEILNCHTKGAQAMFHIQCSLMDGTNERLAIVIRGWEMQAGDRTLVKLVSKRRASALPRVASNSLLLLSTDLCSAFFWWEAAAHFFIRHSDHLPGPRSPPSWPWNNPFFYTLVLLVSVAKSRFKEPQN